MIIESQLILTASSHLHNKILHVAIIINKLIHSEPLCPDHSWSQIRVKILQQLISIKILKQFYSQVQHTLGFALAFTVVLFYLCWLLITFNIVISCPSVSILMKQTLSMNSGGYCSWRYWYSFTAFTSDWCLNDCLREELVLSVTPPLLPLWPNDIVPNLSLTATSWTLILNWEFCLIFHFSRSREGPTSNATTVASPPAAAARLSDVSPMLAPISTMLQP